MSQSYPYSALGDNAGRCEGCNEPGSEYRTQTTWPVSLPSYGGGAVMGSMWLCPKCLREHQERDALQKYDGCAL